MVLWQVATQAILTYIEDGEGTVDITVGIVVMDIILEEIVLKAIPIFTFLVLISAIIIDTGEDTSLQM